MTKKDYIIFAEILGKRYFEKRNGQAMENQEYRNAIGNVVEDLCHFFQKDNFRFDINRFIEAVYTKD